MLNRAFLKQQNCNTTKEYFNKLLGYYFQNTIAQLCSHLENLSPEEKEWLWQHANTRHISAKDSERLAQILFV